MCGRIVCNLSPNDVQSKCQFTNKKGLNATPKVRGSCNGQKCSQSYNISPTQITPILMCEKVAEDNELFIDNRIIQAMKWGLIPSWSKDSTTLKLSTHNAKIETCLEKNLFRYSLKKGNRCVVIIEGFYEWENKKQKQPYLIKNCKESILFLAAIYDTVETSDGIMYSYAILTEGAHGKLASIHHRSPVILHNTEELELWLNSENLKSETAVKYLLNRSWTDDDLEIFPVSTLVNNSSNNDPQCIVKLEKSISASPKSNVLTRWLKVTDSEEPDIKKFKKDNL